MASCNWRRTTRDVCALMRMRWVRRTLCIVVPLVCLLCVVFWTSTMNTIIRYLDCSDYYSKVYLKELCQNYNKGLITGSLCEPLCVTKELQFQTCLGHGVKLHVLQAEWKGRTVVIKTPKALGSRLARTHLEESESDMKLTREEFIAQANVSLFENLAGNINSQRTVEVIEHIFSECDVGGDGILHYDEALPCWQLVETEEYALFSMLQGKSGIPDIYGTCGNMYAVQYANAEPFWGLHTTPSSGTRPWNLRAKLAIALLDMIESIEHTPYGTLYLCDIQESNFGVVERDDKLVAKAIDVDISWFEPGMISAVAYEKNKTCSGHTDCEFISCQVDCIHNKCSGQLVSNNLMMICRRIFRQRYKWHPALLIHPPEHIRQRMEDLLERCAHPGESQTHVPQELLTQLRTLLHSSIEEAV